MTKQFVDRSIFFLECGIRPAYSPPFVRIVGGDIADPNAWPWHVSVHGGQDQKYFCGASILTERWILTAGHCIGGQVTVCLIYCGIICFDNKTNDIMPTSPKAYAQEPFVYSPS